MKITPGQAEALARFLLTIRPEWSKHYTSDAVAQMRFIDDDLERVVAAAVRGALSAKIAKPDVLAMNGEHWKQPASSDSTGGPQIAVRERCGKCWRMHPPDTPCPPMDEEAYMAALGGLASARARLAEARGELCPCGVLPADCEDHRHPEESA